MVMFAGNGKLPESVEAVAGLWCAADKAVAERARDYAATCRDREVKLREAEERRAACVARLAELVPQPGQYRELVTHVGNDGVDVVLVARNEAGRVEVSTRRVPFATRAKFPTPSNGRCGCGRDSCPDRLLEAMAPVVLMGLHLRGAKP
jgi:hypothetical protein